MGYYLMRVNRSSFADILVKADTLANAEKRLDDWFDGRDNEDFNVLLSERDRDNTELKRYFPTIEEYNRSGVVADFEINMPDEPKEPRYDLYIILDEEPCHYHRKVWQDLTMESVLNIMKEYNQRYVLTKKSPYGVKLLDAVNRGCDAIFYYKAEKRKD